MTDKTIPRKTVVYGGHSHIRRNDYVRGTLHSNANAFQVLPDHAGRVHHFLRDRTIETWDIDAALEMYNDRVAYVGREAALHEVLTATAPLHGRESKRDYTERKDRLIAHIRHKQNAGTRVRVARSPGGIPAHVKQSKNARRKRLRYGK